MAKNIEKEARGAKYLYIWTDCDREGEHIGTEIRDIALKVNSRLEVKRAKFSNIERGYEGITSYVGFQGLTNSTDMSYKPRSTLSTSTSDRQMPSRRVWNWISASAHRSRECRPKL